MPNTSPKITASITLSKEAAEHVLSMLKKRSYGLGLRFGLRVSGCTGFRYDLDYADEILDDEKVFEQHGVKLIVKSKYLKQLDGMVINFNNQSLLNQGFEFTNPNVKDACGCGESIGFGEEQ